MGASVFGGKMNIAEHALVNEIIDAWENLKGGRNYDEKTIQDWLIDDMKPVIDKARKFVGRKVPYK
jgi:hypothetical protein